MAEDMNVYEENCKKVENLLEEYASGLMTHKEFWSRLSMLSLAEYEKAR